MKEALKWLTHFLKEDDRVVVAVSGGPDSMVLLSLILQIRQKKDIDIICAHVNHKIRPESDEEEKFVEKFCKKHHVIFEKMDIEKYSDENFHEEARKKRYDFFEHILDKHRSPYLMTAHHGDDLIETVLMRLVRGSTLKGYSGFQKISEIKNYSIIRPLIELTKEEIEYYAKEHKIPFVIDSSNEKDKYTRNRYRKYILPRLKEEDPKVHLKFYKFSKLAYLYSEYINKEVERYIKKVYKNGVLYLKEYKLLDELLQVRILEEILNKVYREAIQLINDHHTKLIMDAIQSEKPNVLLNLPNNVIVRKNYQNLRIDYLEEYIDAYKLELLDDMILPNNHRIQKMDFENGNGNDICRINLEDVKLPLIVRTKQPGDRISVKGMLGSKKVKNILIENKINPVDRELWPLVVDADGMIIWIPGLKKSKIDVPSDRKCDIILKYY